MKPACVIGSPKGKTKDHVLWCCSLYKLQVEEGRMFVHEAELHQINGSSDKRLREVRERCSQDFGPSTVIPLLTVSSEESTREAEKDIGFKYFRRGQHKTSARAKARGEE